MRTLERQRKVWVLDLGLIIVSWWPTRLLNGLNENNRSRQRK